MGRDYAAIVLFFLLGVAAGFLSHEYVTGNNSDQMRAQIITAACHYVPCGNFVYNL